MVARQEGQRRCRRRRVFPRNHKNCVDSVKWNFKVWLSDRALIQLRCGSGNGIKKRARKKGTEMTLCALFSDFSQTTCRNRSSCLSWCCTRTFSRSCMQWHTRRRNRPSLHHPKEQSYIRQRKVRRRRQEQEETFSSDSPFLAAIAANNETKRVRNCPAILIKARFMVITTGLLG